MSSRPAQQPPAGPDATVFVMDEKKLDHMLPGEGIKSSKLLAKIKLLSGMIAPDKKIVNLQFLHPADMALLFTGGGKLPLPRRVRARRRE